MIFFFAGSASTKPYQPERIFFNKKNVGVLISFADIQYKKINTKRLNIIKKRQLKDVK